MLAVIKHEINPLLFEALKMRPHVGLVIAEDERFPCFLRVLPDGLEMRDIIRREVRQKREVLWGVRLI